MSPPMTIAAGFKKLTAPASIGVRPLRSFLMPPLRATIAGAGFIGAVHARSARLAGARIVGVAASSPETARRAAAAVRAAQITDAVLVSARKQRWVDVAPAAREPAVHLGAR